MLCCRRDNSVTKIIIVVTCYPCELMPCRHHAKALPTSATLMLRILSLPRLNDGETEARGSKATRPKFYN